MNATPISTHINVLALLSGLAFACLSLGTAISQAADGAASQEFRTIVVQYEDLNIANPKGMQLLYQRIVAAANQVCDSGDHRSVQAFARDRHCKELSIAHAVEAVNRPELTALHAAKTRRPIADSGRLVHR